MINIEAYNGYGQDAKTELIFDKRFAVSATRLVMLKLLDDLRQFIVSETSPFISLSGDLDLTDETTEPQEADQESWI